LHKLISKQECQITTRVNLTSDSLAITPSVLIGMFKCIR